jgi:hypothetical protein
MTAVCLQLCALTGGCLCAAHENPVGSVCVTYCKETGRCYCRWPVGRSRPRAAGNCRAASDAEAGRAYSEPFGMEANGQAWCRSFCQARMGCCWFEWKKGDSWSVLRILADSAAQDTAKLGGFGRAGRFRDRRDCL